MKKLTPKQRRFAEEYAREPNGAGAARRAGYSEKAAKEQAYQFFHDPKLAHVAEYVDQLLEDDAAQRKIDHDILRQRLRHRLTTDMREYYTAEGKYKLPSELTAEQAQHLQAFSYNSYRNESAAGAVQEGETINLVLTSATKAEDMLGRHSGFFAKGDKALDTNSDYIQAAEELEDLLAEIGEEARETEREIVRLAAKFEADRDAAERRKT